MLSLRQEPSHSPADNFDFAGVYRGKDGTRFAVRRLRQRESQRLIEMYLAFQPRNSFQGLPPLKDEACVAWVRKMLSDGTHLIAELVGDDMQHRSLTDALVGHAAIFPVSRSKCELLVVVWPGYYNLGIGTALVRRGIDRANELGYERMWLEVDATNVRARHVYRKCGFEYVADCHGRELDMACDVRRWRSRPSKCVPRADRPHFRFPALSEIVVGEVL
jgi:diamine N-acetyltransferase